MPNFASTSAEQISYAKEPSFGVMPTSGDHKNIRITGEGFDFTVTKEASKEINKTRTTSSMVATGAKAPGSIQFELSYLEYDELLASTLQDAWVEHGTKGVSSAVSEISFTATTLTATAPTSGANDWSLLQKGQWFIVVAPSDLNNGKVLRVSAITAPTASIITLDTNTPAEVSASVANCKLGTSRLTHGTTKSSFVFQREHSDVSQFFAYLGQTPSKFSLSLTSSALTTGSFDFMGKTAERSNTSAMPGSATESQDHEIHSSVSGSIAVLWENGVPLTSTSVKKLDISYDNTLREQDALGTFGTKSIGVGSINLTGSMSVYFANGDLFDKFKANISSSLVFSSVDADGNGYVFTIPKINIGAHKFSGGSKDQDFMVDLQFTGMRDAGNAVPALRKAFFIDRIGTAAV